jgi:FAD/FMN-containing dehydrogenase
LIDGGALALVEGNPEGFRWPAGVGAAIVFKQEAAGAGERDELLGEWLTLLGERLESDGSGKLLDAAVVAETQADLEKLRSFRHRVPAVLNERVRRTRDAGAGKLGTDWWVPYRRLPGFLDTWMQRIDSAGLEALVFGHVGNGHPHINFLLRDAGERQRAEDLVLEMCREAVAEGGGVAGEHGLGKRKRHLLSVQYPGTRIEAMRAIKRAWDPAWILGRGNLFEESE